VGEPVKIKIVKALPEPPERPHWCWRSVYKWMPPPYDEPVRVLVESTGEVQLYACPKSGGADELDE